MPFFVLQLEGSIACVEGWPLLKDRGAGGHMEEEMGMDAGERGFVCRFGGGSTGKLRLMASVWGK